MKMSKASNNTENQGFFEKVYQQVAKIPCGQVATYGQIALLCQSPRASRAVGWALHVNPMPGVIPCHRVVNREGRMAPAFAFGGPDVQRELLRKEQVSFLSNGCVDMRRAQWNGK